MLKYDENNSFKIKQLNIYIFKVIRFFRFFNIFIIFIDRYLKYY